MPTITILAPSSTNASGAIVTTLTGGTTGSVQLYAATDYNPGVMTWSCTAPAGIGVSGTNGANPYRLSQLLAFTHVPSGTTSLTIKATDGSTFGTTTISIVPKTIALAPANPIIAVGGTATLTATASYASPTYTESSWSAKTSAGADVTAAVGFTQVNAGSWAAVTATFPSGNPAFVTGASIYISLTDSVNDASARTTVLLAPSGVTDSNVSVAYGADGSIYMANNAWASGLPTGHWTLAESGLPYPMQQVLREGVYAADISGQSVSTICCYILNLKTFNAVFDL